MKRLMVPIASWMLAGEGPLGPVKRWLAGLFLRYFPGQITCAEFNDFIVAYHEGELTDRQRRIFEFHFTICPMCRAQFEGYLRTIELGQKVFADDDDAPVPAGVEEEMINAIVAARSRP